MIFIARTNFRITLDKNPYALKAAALAAGSLLMTPYLMDYDLFVLLPALVFMGRYQTDRGFVPYGKGILILLWGMCAFARELYAFSGLPFGFLTLLGAFLFCVYLMKQDQIRVAPPPCTPTQEGV